MRETLKFNVEEFGELEVYKTKTCRDEIQIETEAGKLAGGGVELIKFKIGVSNQYDKVQSQAKNIEQIEKHVKDIKKIMKKV